MFVRKENLWWIASSNAVDKKATRLFDRNCSRTTFCINLNSSWSIAAISANRTSWKTFTFLRKSLISSFDTHISLSWDISNRERNKIMKISSCHNEEAKNTFSSTNPSDIVVAEKCIDERISLNNKWFSVFRRRIIHYSTFLSLVPFSENEEDFNVQILNWHLCVSWCVFIIHIIMSIYEEHKARRKIKIWAGRLWKERNWQKCLFLLVPAVYFHDSEY